VEFGDGVPVAGGAGGLESAVEGSGCDFGLADAVGVVGEDFVVDEVDLLVFPGNGFEEGLSLRAGGGAQEVDVEFVGRDGGVGGEGIRGEDSGELLGGAEDDFGTEAAGLFDSGFDCCGEGGGELREMRMGMGYFTAGRMRRSAPVSSMSRGTMPGMARKGAVRSLPKKAMYQRLPRSWKSVLWPAWGTPTRRRV
jgi:hypothetical protein